MKTSKPQYDAIHHADGPMMVLAGPGAGKTYVITNRIYNLISECGVLPGQILVVTFSRAAAEQMRDRFVAMSEGKYRGVNFGTFHSVFFGILKKAYHFENKDIVTDSLKYRFIGEAIAETDYEVEDKQEFLEDIEKEISRVKSDRIDINNYYPAGCPESIFRQIYNGYQERLKFHRALDFDDMVLYAYDLLSQRKDILQGWQKVYKYVLIDEFQDINRLQYETIKMLASPEDNIFIVGDDDQSIYGFRGARPDIMLGFTKQYPNAKTITLDMNYRCTSEILSASTKLINRNKKRYKKDLKAYNTTGEKVHIGSFADLRSEAEMICSSINKHISNGVEPEQIAVLFRTNVQMRTLAGKLMEYGMDFSMKESVPNIFKSFIGRDITTYLKIALGDNSRESYLKIINRPVRYISRKAFTGSTVDMRDVRNYYLKNNQYWMIDRIKEFEDGLQTIKNMTPLSAIHFIRYQIGYNDFLKEKAKESGIKPEDWLETADEIQESAAGMKSIYEWISYVESYDERMKEKMSKNENNAQGIKLMTMHSAKGLEFDVVYVPTLVEQVCPYRKAVLPDEIEEERRMLYVAMTRAKKELHLSYVKKRHNKTSDISRFLTEIDPTLLKNK
ncbi:MAG: ATP-dependent helicase [Eubacterium sp.]|nr:ATP-dependent helicase [Eubacterium sp.]